MPAADQRFAALLIESYAYGLTQARRSFSVSLSCSVLGGVVLLSGISMAIFRADSTGGQYASVTSSVSGLLMTVIGTLFHRRADLALKHMEAQTQSLRQDMKVERDAGQAIRLLEDVEDPVLKAHLQAALILKSSAAKLPELGGLLKPPSPLLEPGVNGALPQQQSEGPRRDDEALTAVSQSSRLGACLCNGQVAGGRGRWDRSWPTRRRW